MQETVPSGYEQTGGTSYYSITAISGFDSTGNDFANFEDINISGTKYNEVTGDGLSQDDTPLGGQVVLPKWLSLIPVATFAASVGMGMLGMLFSSAAALSLAFALFALSCALFLMAPFVALLASRRGR